MVPLYVLGSGGGTVEVQSTVDTGPNFVVYIVEQPATVRMHKAPTRTTLELFALTLSAPIILPFSGRLFVYQ